MKRLTVFVLISSLVVPLFALAQAQEAKTLAATMNVYVFPKQGQDKTQQSKDEAECYSWALEQVGTDPFDQAKRAEQAAQQGEQAKAEAKDAGQGAGAKGAVRGAAAGALIGEIASDDPGQGAAYGAAAGLIRGRRKARKSEKEATQQADQQVQQVQQASAAQIDEFKKAFSVCLEAKEYLVKF